MILSNEIHLFRFRGDNINTINELVNNEIWHSKIDGLNDPFELFFSLDDSALYDLNESEIREIIKETQFYKQQKEVIEHCLASGQLKPIHDHINEYWGSHDRLGLLRTLQKNITVACFTKEYDSRLMWGYYGNGMKGICFAYNKKKLKTSGLEFSDVIYQNEAPKVNIYKHLLEHIRHEPTTFNGGFSLIKHSDWIKESEVRSLKSLSENHEYQQLPGKTVQLKECCIDAVIIGERLGGDMRIFIENFARNNGIKIMTARADLTNYKIIITE